MDRAAFERAMALGPEEFMPCVTPLGYPAAKMSLRETMMRKAVRADNREPFEALFFDGDFDTPLSAEKAGSLREPLERVRLAPSAVNRQPWRVLVGGGCVHFYKKGSKGYISAANAPLDDPFLKSLDDDTIKVTFPGTGFYTLEEEAAVIEKCVELNEGNGIDLSIMFVPAI